jgi:hypothetical protein
MKKLVILSLITIALISCHTAKKTTTDATTGATKEAPEKPAPAANAASIPSPPTIVYKTRNDYSQNVPVGYGDKRIKSFPAPTDLYTNGKLALPTALQGGYWLDNRGISPEVAFLSYTYSEYSQLPTVPNDLYQKLLDTDPITEMWDCGPRHTFADHAKEVNQIIKDGELKSRCRQLR